MSDAHHHQVRVPRGALTAAGILIALTLATVAAFRVSGVDPIAQVPEAEADVDSRQLRFEDRPNGAVAVYETGTGDAERLVHVIEPGAGGFIRGVLRSLARARRASGISHEHPFELIEQPDGRLLLEDPTTGQRIYLQAFGPTNVESFRTLMAREEPRS